MSFDTVHALDRLPTARAARRTRRERRGRPARAPSCRPRTTRSARPARGCGTGRYAATANATQGLPAAPHRIVYALPGHDPSRAARRWPADCPGHPVDLDIARAAPLQSELRLIAWAVCHDDPLADHEDVATVRRVEGRRRRRRVDQLSLYPGDAHPVELIDEQPDPDDLPATHPPLARLATAAQPART